MTFMGRLVLVFPLLLVLAAGCAQHGGSAPAKVSGKVTYNGKALGGGTITFYPESGGVYAVTIDDDGTYAGTDLPVGDMPVTVETDSVKAAAKATSGYVDPKTGQKAPSSPLVQQQDNAPKGEYVKIPAKYKDKTKSGLTVTLAPGRQVKDFDLKD